MRRVEFLGIGVEPVLKRHLVIWNDKGAVGVINKPLTFNGQRVSGDFCYRAGLFG